jgi:hypothetical protein
LSGEEQMRNPAMELLQNTVIDWDKGHVRRYSILLKAKELGDILRRGKIPVKKEIQERMK